MSITLKEVDQVEILTLQDNYIDLVSGDSNEIIQRAMPLKGNELKNSILAEHGFSALVKTSTSNMENHNILFDFGLSEFGAAYNAEALNIDLTSVEAMAISHGHSDHTTGLEQLAGKVGKKGISLFAHPAVFRHPRYVKFSEEVKIYFPSFTKEMVQDIGLNLVETKEPHLFLNDSLLFLGEIPRQTEFEKGMPNVYYEENGEEKFDHIEDDTAIVANLRGKGLILISGCAHSGIINTLKYAMNVTGIDKIHVVMGGFHLTGPHFEPIIGTTAEALKEINPDYVIPTHCTGRKAINHIEKEMPEKFLLNMVGTKLTFGK